jgi:hypothetical protein
VGDPKPPGALFAMSARRLPLRRFGPNGLRTMAAPSCALPIPATVSVLRCVECGRKMMLTEDDLIYFVLRGWPECCGRVMTLPAAAASCELHLTTA